MCTLWCACVIVDGGAIFEDTWLDGVLRLGLDLPAVNSACEMRLEVPRLAATKAEERVHTVWPSPTLLVADRKETVLSPAAELSSIMRVQNAGGPFLYNPFYFLPSSDFLHHYNNLFALGKILAR